VTLHLVDLGTPGSVRPTRLRSIVESLNAQSVDPERIVAVGTATEHARAAGLDAGRLIGGRPSARRLARWTHGHGRVVAWGEWPLGVPDGVAWAERAPTSWRAASPSSICGLAAVEVIARLALLGCTARVVVAPCAARLDRARALAHDMHLDDALIVLEDHAALATVAACAAIAVAAPTIDGSCTHATQVGVPECLAAFAAAGTACLAQHGSASESWVLKPQGPGGNELALCLARMLASTGELADAGTQARAVATELRDSPVTA
jgi:hypothetical protein